jgi:hypothetical protein
VTPVDAGHRADLAELVASNGAGAAQLRAGRAKLAVAVFERVARRCREALGSDHIGALTVTGNLAVSLISSGRRREGIELLLANVADRSRVLGEEDPRTLIARDALAVGYRLAGRVDEAVELSAQVVALRTRVLGPQHPDTLTSRMGLLLAQAAAGDVESATAGLVSALTDAERALGLRHRHTLAIAECGSSIGLVHVTS